MLDHCKPKTFSTVQYLPLNPLITHVFSQSSIVWKLFLFPRPPPKVNFSHNPVFLLKKNLGRARKNSPGCLLRLQKAGRAPPDRLLSFCSKINHDNVLWRKFQLSRLICFISHYIRFGIKRNTYHPQSRQEDICQRIFPWQLQPLQWKEQLQKASFSCKSWMIFEDWCLICVYVSLNDSLECLIQKWNLRNVFTKNSRYVYKHFCIRINNWWHVDVFE